MNESSRPPANVIHARRTYSLIVALGLLTVGCQETSREGTEAKAPIGETEKSAELPERGTWTVHADGDACYARGVASRVDSAVAPRKETYVQVSHLPAANFFDEVFVIPGYNYAAGSHASASVDGGAVFRLTADGYKSLAPDGTKRKLINQMLRGNQLSVSGLNEAGVEATDVFPLGGFPDAYEEINRLCKKTTN